MAVFAVLLIYPWGFLQTPLFEMADAPLCQVIEVCSLATLSDAVIMLVAYWTVALFRTGRTWIVKPRAVAVVLFSAGGVAITIVIERLAVTGLWHIAGAIPSTCQWFLSSKWGCPRSFSG